MTTLLKAPLKVLDRMTEDEFFWFCAANPDLRVERNRHGQIILMTPTGSETGIFDSALTTEISVWNRRTKLGKTSGSSAGFTLPDKSVKSADVAWIQNERWENLSAADRKKFAHVCPDFVAEIQSPSDSHTELQGKMAEWIGNGCRLGWLIDPKKRRVEIYTPGKTSAGNWNSLSGEEILPGLWIDLAEIFEM